MRDKAMILACKCQNFVASPEVRPEQAPADPGPTAEWLATTLCSAFQRRFDESFPFYATFVNYFKNADDLVSHLSNYSVKQSDLLYGLTLNITEGPSRPPASEFWQVVLCINCNTVICAKRTGNQRNAYLIRSDLLISQQEVKALREDKSYSEAFQIVLFVKGENGDSPSDELETTEPPNSKLSESQARRLHHLRTHEQERIKREIAETNKRIERYTEDQLIKLNAFQRQSERELTSLTRRITEMPDSASGWFDEKPPELANFAPNDFVDRNYELGALDESRNQRETGKSAIEASLLPNIRKLAGSITSKFDTPPATPEAVPICLIDTPFGHKLKEVNSDPNFDNQISQSSSAGEEEIMMDDDVFGYNDEFAYSDDFVDDDGDVLEATESVDYSSPRAIPLKATDQNEFAFGKSLPIPMPSLSRNIDKDDLEQYHTDKNQSRRIDIAASIRALAKSVHGDAVFGDLPRPRLRSQI